MHIFLQYDEKKGDCFFIFKKNPNKNKKDLTPILVSFSHVRILGVKSIPKPVKHCSVAVSLSVSKICNRVNG